MEETLAGYGWALLLAGIIVGAVIVGALWYWWAHTHQKVKLGSGPRLAPITQGMVNAAMEAKKRSAAQPVEMRRR